jgi:Mg-chelatase subunit ChlD/anti-sigma factor RsiW
MNPDQPSREEIEARITALLLGELPDDEAQLLRWTIAQDLELQKLHDRLKSTIGFMHEAVKPSVDAITPKDVPLKLSPERRQKLLAHFKTPRANKLFWLKRIEVPTLVPVLAVLAVVALLVAIAVPNFVKSRSSSQRSFGTLGLSRGGPEESLSGERDRAMVLNKRKPVGVTRLAAGPAPPPPVAAAPAAEAPAGGIVLPEAQPSSTEGGVYPQTVVGFTPVPNNFGAPVTTPSDSLSTVNAGLNDGFALGVGGKSRAAGENTATWGLSQGTFDHGVIAGGLASPSEPAKGLAENGAENVPVLGNMPLSGQLIRGTSFQQRLAKTENRAANSAGAPMAAAMLPSAPAGGSRRELSEPDSAIPGAIKANRNVAKDKSREQNVFAFDSVNGKPQQPAKATLQSQALQTREQAQITPNGIFQATNAIEYFVTGLNLDDANGLRTLNSAGSSAGSELSKSPTPPAAPPAEKPNAASVATAALPSQSVAVDEDKLLPAPSLPPPVPQPEILTRDNAFSTFSLNVSDVSFKLAAASLEKGRMPDAASIRSEEFINAFDYRDPEAAVGQPLAFTAERARYPFAHNRELLRFSVKTAAAGRQAGRALNLVLLLDTSGSMERADRVAIIREALRVLVAQLQPQDTVSVVTFARTARLWADGVPGDKAGEALGKVSGITPEGGTNLEEAMRLAYETARRHYLANGINRVVMLTDGAANLGNVDPNALRQKVEANRKQGIALDCFGIGWEGYNDDLLEQLSSNGDGRYAFMNSPDKAAAEFAAKLAGALQVAAQDVKVQVEFNPQRVVSWRQIGYAKHQLTKEQFRDNTVAAGEIAAQEAGNALYTIETKPDGGGPIVTVRVRYKVPGTTDYRERSWDVDYRGNAPALEQSSAAMRLAATASAFSEWLASSPFAEEVTPDELLGYLSGVPEVYGADPRPKQLEWMIRQAKSVSGK